MERNKVLISGLPGEDIISCTELIIYFQSKKKSGGGDVLNVQYLDEGSAIISFDNEVVASNVLDKEHFIKGYPIQTTAPPMDIKREAQSNTITDIESSCSSDGDPEELCTVQVNGVPSMTTQDSLHNYLENKSKSKGGPVKRVELKRSHDMATVVFQFEQDAKRVAEYRNHKLDGYPLNTSLIASSSGNKETYFKKGRKESLHEDVPLDFIVCGISEKTTEDSLTNYLENTRRSGGGTVEAIEVDREDGIAQVKLQNVESLDRLLGDHHRLDNSRLLIIVKEPEKAVPIDPYKVHVKGLNTATTKDGLELYMEKMSEKDVQHIQFGSYGNALISFKEPPDFDEMTKKMENYKKGLEGCKPLVEPVPYCCCIKISGLDEKTTEHGIILYFDNEKKGCGKEPSRVEFQGQGTALVYFDAPFVIDKALGKRHELDKAELKLEMVYPFLTEEKTTHKGRGTKRRTTTVEVDPAIMTHVMKNYPEDIQGLQDETAIELEWTPGETSAKLKEKSAAKYNNESWMEKVKLFERFLDRFTCEKISVEPPLWDEFLAKLSEELISTNESNGIDITHDDFINEVRITGKKNSLQMVVNAIETLISGVHEDKALQDSIETKTDKDLEPEKLALLKLSDLYKNISSNYKHITIHVDEEKNEVVLHGPRKHLQEVSMEMYMLFSKIKEEILEFPERVLRVLETPKGAEFVCSSLLQNQIKAVLVCGQRRFKNEASIFAFNRNQAKEASMFIQSVLAERSIHLKEENIQVIETPKWNDLIKDLEAQCKVNVVFESHSQTLWISGVEPDVCKCFEVVENYIEKNTILDDTIVVSNGCSRYIFQRLGKEIKDIEAKFVDGFLKIQPGNDGEIILTGTNEEIKKGKEELKLLVTGVCEKQITIEKPGTKKLFKSSKGAKLIKAIESENSCVVEIVDSDQLERREAGFLKEDNSQNETLGEILCGYITKEGKKLVVYKDDLTKHRVDVIVNAANENLQHVGGLAKAIVSEGGHGIQHECDRIIEKSGSVLEGHVVVTNPGQLPCKKLFHAVGPRWDSFNDYRGLNESRKEALLKFTFENCLNEAKNFLSIAIPAVSSGIFGFPLDRCARILVETIIIFFRKNPACNLSEVHLTNNDDVTVKSFCDEMRKRFGKEEGFFLKGKAANALHRSKTLSPLRAASDSSSERVSTPEGVSISVIVGDISQENADVLVNTAGEDLDLQKNACARSFISAAGPKLQTFCNRIAPVQVGDIGITQAGKLKCQYVFHAVTCEWGSGKGEQVLREILQKCLKEAERRGASSIAIPAIGTGVLGFPRNAVARIFFEEVFSFSKSQPSTLNEVKFVLYEKDKPTIKAFTNEIASNSTTSSGGISIPPKRIGSRKSNNFYLRKRKENWFEIDMGELSVHVQSGNITEENTDALVVISNPELDLEIGGGAGTAILKAGGPSIKRECQQHPSLKSGEVSVTTAGRLNVNRLIHCVPPSNKLNEAALITVVLNCLRYSEQHGFSSISFPAIGTGNLGVPSETCAKAMLMALERFSKQKPKTVQLVRIVIYQDAMVKDFYSKMKEFVGEMPDKHENPGIFERFTNFLGWRASKVPDDNKTEMELTECSEVVLCVYSGDQTALYDAVKSIREIANENCKRQTITHDMIAHMEENNLSKIRTLEHRYDCKIEVELEIERIIVEGNNEDILSAMANIHDILHEVSDRVKTLEHAELLAEDVQWEYGTDDDGFVPYSKELNAKIEYAYKNRRKNITFDDEGEDLKINFTRMTEYSKQGQTMVKRKSLKGVSLPDYWIPQPKDKSGKEEPVHLVELDPNKHTNEYLKISDSVKKTLPGGNKIMKIQRVQNPGQYKIYAARKQKMDEHNSKGCNEKMLFHGTSREGCKSINFTGFNRSYGKRNVWGHGVYFAKDASYSARSDYSPPDLQGKRYMYLARVLTGEYILGDQFMSVPPPKDPSNPVDTFDTVVDDVANPKIFVAFFDNQAYPEYLITFQ